MSGEKEKARKIDVPDQYDRPICEIFQKFAYYYNLKYQQENVKPLYEWKPLYREQMGKFLFLVNGTMPEVTDPETKMKVPGFHMTIFYNGWICAVISPFEGTVMCNERGESLESTIIDVLDKYIKKLELYLH